MIYTDISSPKRGMRMWKVGYAWDANDRGFRSLSITCITWFNLRLKGSTLNHIWSNIMTRADAVICAFMLRHHEEQVFYDKSNQQNMQFLTVIISIHQPTLIPSSSLSSRANADSGDSPGSIWPCDYWSVYGTVQYSSYGKKHIASFDTWDLLYVLCINYMLMQENMRKYFYLPSWKLPQTLICLAPGPLSKQYPGSHISRRTCRILVPNLALDVY